MEVEVVGEVDGMLVPVAPPTEQPRPIMLRLGRGQRLPKLFEEDQANDAVPENDEVKEMREHLKSMRSTIRANDKIIKKSAVALRCPLLGRQMRQVGLATDGNLYDLRSIQKYIQSNMGAQMVSPVDREPMHSHVHWMREKNGREIMQTWMPQLSADPPPAAGGTSLAVAPASSTA